MAYDLILRHGDSMAKFFVNAIILKNGNPVNMTKLFEAKYSNNYEYKKCRKKYNDFMRTIDWEFRATRDIPLYSGSRIRDTDIVRKASDKPMSWREYRNAIDSALMLEIELQSINEDIKVHR